MKVKTFASTLPPNLFTLMKTLLHPASYEVKTFDELTSLLKKHLNPPPLAIPSQHAFWSRKQQEGASVLNFVSALRKLAVVN